jgi:hypothetical protein
MDSKRTFPSVDGAWLLGPTAQLPMEAINDKAQTAALSPT